MWRQAEKIEDAFERGYEAYLFNEPLDSNPEKLSELFRAWEDGWKEAKEEN